MEPVVEYLRDRLAREAGIAAAYLFGSRARGNARPDNDADLALVFAGRPVDPLERAVRLGLLAEDLREAAGLPVDVLDFDAVDPRTARIILHDAQVLVDRDRRRRLAAELRQMSLYHDRQALYEAERQRTLAFFGLDGRTDREVEPR